MKRLLLLFLALLLILCGCSEDQKPTEPTKLTQNEDSAPEMPTAAPTQPTEAPTPLSEYSDFELIEATVKSSACAFRYAPSYEVHNYTDQEWAIYMMENCKPFQELMFRDTALESLELYAPVMIARYVEAYPNNASGLLDLVAYLIPEMEDFLFRVGYFQVDEAVQTSYASFLSAAMSEDPSVLMEHMHFEDDASAVAFQETFSPLTEAEVLRWDYLNEDENNYLYAVTTFVRSEQVSQGQNVIHFVARFDHEYLVMPDLGQIPAGLKEDADLSEYIDWSVYSDESLMEETLKSYTITHRTGNSYYADDPKWLEYMVDVCEPFEELMSRETALSSLEQYAPALVERYKGAEAEKALAFADLVVILIPEMSAELYSDYELMEQTLQDDVVTWRWAISIPLTNQEWVQYMKENCIPFRRLMERDTALESLRKDAVSLVEKYREEKPLNAVCFAELATILVPELEGSTEWFVLPEDPTLVEINWIVPETYNTYIRAAMSGAVPLRYMHFENEAAEAAFSESFSTYTDAITEGFWKPLSETLYAANVLVCTEQNPEGQEVTHFVGCIDDQWLVMLSVDQIPAELKDDLDLSEYE